MEIRPQHLWNVYILWVTTYSLVFSRDPFRHFITHATARVHHFPERAPSLPHVRVRISSFIPVMCPPPLRSSSPAPVLLTWFSLTCHSLSLSLSHCVFCLFVFGTLPLICSYLLENSPDFTLHKFFWSVKETNILTENLLCLLHLHSKPLLPGVLGTGLDTLHTSCLFPSLTHHISTLLHYFPSLSLPSLCPLITVH